MRLQRAMSPTQVVVLLTTPHTTVDMLGKQLARSGNGLFLGDLNLSFGRSVGELLQVYELSQIPVHEPLYEFLRLHVSDAAADPRAFLAARSDWSFQQLLQFLIAQASAPLVIFADTTAGFRIVQAERWLQALPQALFVHAVSDRAAFADAASRHYAGHLFVPPDYRDYCVLNKAPQFQPDLAWFQVHRTLSRALADAPGIRYCHLPLDTAQTEISLDSLQRRANEAPAPFQVPSGIDALEASLLSA
jgi:hypothetical protein